MTALTEHPSGHTCTYFQKVMTRSSFMCQTEIGTMYALAGVAQWIECRPENQRVAGSIPSQGTCLGYHVPGRGHVRGNHTLMFLSLPSSSLPHSLKINK